MISSLKTKTRQIPFIPRPKIQPPKMEETLIIIEAAKRGDITKLENLTKSNGPFLLRAAALCYSQSPLHIACIGGHVDFVRKVLNLNPQFATDLSQDDGLSPLHVASANGDLEIVRELLKVGSHVCLVQGKEKRIPLHYAVSKGRTSVVRELLSISDCKDSITQVTVRGETCLHLAVKNNQFEAFEVLVRHIVAFGQEDVLNKTDEKGNTILHLTASRKQYEFVDLLLDKNFSYKGNLEINMLNKQGYTPLDVLILQGGDSDIEQMLTLAGALGSNPVQHGAVSQPQPFTDPSPPIQSEQDQPLDRPKSPYKRLQAYFKYDRIKDSPSKVRNMLLVISVLIATATYQAVLSPPGGVWQDDYWPDTRNSTAGGKQSPRHMSGQSVMGTNAPVSYGLFLLFNSIGFFMALHMMNFLTLGLSLQFELRVALFALTSTYDTCMIAITPNGVITVSFIVMSVVMPFAMAALSRVVRDCWKGKRCVSPSTTGRISTI